MYDEALVRTSLVTLSDRRQALTDKIFKKILDNKDSKLRNLLPPQNAKHYNLRKGRQFNPVFKTNRFRNSFIVFNVDIIKNYAFLVTFFSNLLPQDPFNVSS